MCLRRSEFLRRYTAAEYATASMIPFALFRVATTISFGKPICDISGDFVSLSVASICVCRQSGCGYHVVVTVSL